ncbi:MAG TPA: glycosyltransferase family 39 protein [Acidimicrobiales bacterium]|nr:glycosyltransferase family 39 protein [Acidimicrobiales bacterium]
MTEPTTTTRRDLLVLAGLALAIRLPTFFAAKHLTFDDGVFGASAVAMRAGGVPFRDVFSSQGPLFLPLVWIADTLGLHTLNGPRLLGLASGVALVVAVYLAGRELAGPTGARIAGGLAAVTGSSIAVTGSLAADGPAMAFAATCMYLALRYRRDPSPLRALFIGLTIGAAIMVKALVLPVAVPVGLILLWRRRPVDWVLAVGAAVAVGGGLSLLWGFSDVWDQSVRYHLDAPGGSDPVDNAKKLVSTLTTRDVALVATGVLTAVAALSGRWRRADGEVPDQGRTPPVPLLLWAWLAAMVLMLVLEHPMWRPHISELVPPACLLLAWYRPPVKPTAVVAALGTVFMVLTYAGPSLLWAGDYEGDEATVVDTLRELPDDALAISDEPGLVWRSGHRTPDHLVDGSALLTDSGRVTSDTLVDAAARPEVCALVVTSDRFGQFEDLPERLADEGYDVAEDLADPEDPEDRRALYLKADCRP